MPFTPDSWANSPATSSPITAARLTKLGTQHAEAMADVAADIVDAGSDIGGALSATFVRFVDHITGEVIDPAGTVVIKVNVATGDIDDIVFEGV